MGCGRGRPGDGDSGGGSTFFIFCLLQVPDIIISPIVSRPYRILFFHLFQMPDMNTFPTLNTGHEYFTLNTGRDSAFRTLLFHPLH